MNQESMIKEYYGKVLASKNDLKTTACCADQIVPKRLSTILNKMPEEVLLKFYGCGIPIPDHLEDLTVLDLGSGSGRDCFLLSALVGSKGKVIGVDMTDEQIAVAKKHQQSIATGFGQDHSNIEFQKGYIEDLQALNIKDNSIDLVVSNCVINLSPAKEKVFAEIFRCLKPGGELYFSDVFCDRRLPKELAEDPEVLGECLGGAMYTEDFRRLLFDLGAKDYRVIQRSPIEITNNKISQKTGKAKFESITIRAFKLDLEDRCEDYGQNAVYLGGIEDHDQSFTLDDHHTFIKGQKAPVCANTAAMLSETRFSKFFKITGDLNEHHGLFDCGPAQKELSSGGCC